MTVDDFRSRGAAGLDAGVLAVADREQVAVDDVPGVRVAVPSERVNDASRVDNIVQGRWISVDQAYPPLDLTLFDRPIADVASLIAERSGQNIVLSDESVVREKKVTGEIRSKPWHIALEALLEAHGLRAIQDTRSGIITIVSEQRAGVDRRPEFIRLKHLYARDIAPAIEKILGVAEEGESLNAVDVFGDSESSRTLVVYAASDKLAAVHDLVEQADRQPPKVNTKVQMVQVNRTSMRKLGLGYAFTPVLDSIGRQSVGVQVRPVDPDAFRTISSDAGPMAQLVRKLGGLGTVQLGVFLDAVTGAGIAETETAPTITANSGVTAHIMVGDAFTLPNNQPILYGGGGGYMPGQSGMPGQPGMPGAPGMPGVGGGIGGYGGMGNNFGGGLGGGYGNGFGGQLGVGGFAHFETGTQLEVTSYVLSDGQVFMKLELVRDGGQLSPDGRSITGGKQRTATEITVENGQPVVIGGLTVVGRTKADSGIPVLSSLPILGRLFRNEEYATQYQDLVIVVTPHIENDSRVGLR